jgi:hypothetical protein
MVVECERRELVPGRCAETKDENEPTLGLHPVKTTALARVAATRITRS